MSAALDAIEATYLKRRENPLRIIGVRKRAACTIALTATYGLRGDKSVPAVSAGVSRVWLSFIDRLWDLCKHDKYFPVRGIDTNPHFFEEDRAIAAFDLCACCRPTCVIYPQWTQDKIKFKSCGHSNFCPACWAAVVMRQYQQYKQVINAFIGSKPNERLYVTAHTIEQFVAAPEITANEHADPQTLTAAITLIGDRIENLRDSITKNSAQYFSVRRKTVASYWRIVVLPAVGGWRLQLRRLYVSKPGCKIPCHAPRGWRAVLRKTVMAVGGKTWPERKVAEMDDNLAELMIAFSEYPVELLREDIDLTAAYLNAAAKQRLIGGTGKFKCAGSALVKRLRREDQLRKETHAAQKPA